MAEDSQQDVLLRSRKLWLFGPRSGRRGTGYHKIRDRKRTRERNKPYGILFCCARAGDQNKYKKVHGRREGGRLDAKRDDNGVGRADTVVALAGVFVLRAGGLI